MKAQIDVRGISRSLGVAYGFVYVDDTRVMFTTLTDAREPAGAVIRVEPARGWDAPRPAQAKRAAETIKDWLTSVRFPVSRVVFG